MKLFFYTKSSGKSPILDYIDDLSLKDKTKILACLDSIEQMGFESPRVEFRQIEGKLWEIKIKLSSGGHRIFYVTLAKTRMVLLHVYQKQSQKAPKKEIEIALARIKEVEANEKYYKE
ncbi:MAG: type II toxin-antitoxin system RelE/ParE family toxin [Candidatus Caenarcaniphilales bacterium]|jgi:phage-related protein|nr:type II toxin-antitoxin system RelE/ParE family toxin [Candidatus Caenarcaniphilales bacterium]